MTAAATEQKKGVKINVHKWKKRETARLYGYSARKK